MMYVASPHILDMSKEIRPSGTEVFTHLVHPCRGCEQQVKQVKHMHKMDWTRGKCLLGGWRSLGSAGSEGSG